MTAPASLWAVTDIAHPALREVRDACEECLALTRDAISHAAVTGSVGSTYSDRGHSVTVTRAAKVVARTRDLHPTDVMVDADSLIHAVQHSTEAAR